MSGQSAPPQPQPPPQPQARLAQMATGFILSRLVYTAASLGIADHLAGLPKSASEVAILTGCDADSLLRFMRTLTNFDILALGDDGRFSLTPLGEPLRSDVPGSVRGSILTMGGQWSWKTWEAFPSTVKTGQPAFDLVFGMPVFDCHQLMLRGSGTEPILRIYAEANSTGSVNRLLKQGVELTRKV